MAIIPAIGRKTLKIRIVILLIHVILIIGSISMIYPFLMMLSGSMKGESDIQYMDAVPQVFYSEPIQFARFLENRYGSLQLVSAAYGRSLSAFSDATIPKQENEELDGFRQFIRDEMSSMPDYFYVVDSYPMVSYYVYPRNLRRFRDELRAKCSTIGQFNRRYHVTLSNWNDFYGVQDSVSVREFYYENDILTETYLKFKRRSDTRDKVLVNVDGLFWNVQQEFPRVVSGEIKPVPILDEKQPKGPAGDVWAEFVKQRLNIAFIRFDVEGLTLLRKHLSGMYGGSIREMNRVNGTQYTSFDEINADFDELRNTAFFALCNEFVMNACPAKHLRVDTPCTRYRRYMASATATMPCVEYDYRVFRDTKKSFLFEIITRNYRNVVNYLVVYGRAIFNTVVLISLSILAALLVNPIAAYALSRFKLKSTYTILMFFLATMAFPGAVTMIPNFLLLKQLHLMNTYWALILPGLANGYMIFILKGFFDSIPKEVYESAMIDGASEWTMFWRFTMALSKPILALITLGAFTSAYAAFMFALVICPDEKMWTLMVWLYQLQQQAHQSVIYAALVIAAIPTLLVFILAQNTIMKGIVIPVEK
ncbi:MAG: carbohydrate ABC transporter permease [Armatimonadetes bacterium]|nr:carbohydrate ABC transporter permease [Armatimonadota bacterium]